MIEHVQVMTTVGSEQEAELIATSLVEAKLATCVQIGGPVRSRYRWQDAIEEASEWQCLVKTTTAGARGYLTWIDANVE